MNILRKAEVEFLHNSIAAGEAYLVFYDIYTIPRDGYL
jgi:hypothetical protein